MSLKKLMRKLIFAITLTVTGQIYALGDGPRAYWPVPVGINLFTPFYLHIDSNTGFDSALVVPDAEFNTDVLVLMYTRSVAVGGRIGAVSVIAPVGRVDGGLTGTKFQGESSGAGDLVALGVINLYGAPALSSKEYASFIPHTAVDLLFAVTAPTGEFDPNKAINLGADRWSLRTGMPFLHFFSWGPGEATSLELVPSITFFADKSNPNTSDHQLEQKPILLLEGHLTHDITPMFWGSLDTLYTAGGETTKDGVAQHNEQRSLGLGVTLGANFSRNTGASLGYGKIVSHNENGMDGNMLRLSFMHNF